MKTPIYDFVKKYSEGSVARFHMPGHKGASFLGCEELDITEIAGADVLYSPDGIISESERNATELFGTRHTFYSTEGSTLAIKAMLALIKRRTDQGRKTTVLAARNAHKAFLYACALLDIEIRWLYPEVFEHLCSCKISASRLSDALDAYSTLPDAVYITSPDYLGNISDVSALSDVCRKNDIPLLVDNAHGAYLAFTEPSLHPIHLGADMCSDSAHKTLPVLTGGAYLHVSKRFDADEQEVRDALSLFASTSPSYLILQSLDLCNKYLAEGYHEALCEHIAELKRIKQRLASAGLVTEVSEPLKLVFSRSTCGYSGDEIAAHLRANMIEPEFSDRDTLVLMSTPTIAGGDLDKLFNTLASLPKRSHDQGTAVPRPEILQPCISPREAMLSASETVPAEQSLGRICACPTVSCPPAVPIVMSGERISRQAIELMHYYGIKKIEVIKAGKK